MCIDWGMSQVDHVYQNGIFKKTIGDVFKNKNSTLEIRFGSAYSNVANEECAGVWDYI